jgi:AcrR family transcriptional regulator
MSTAVMAKGTGRTYLGRSEAQRREERRARVLAAAFVVYAREGLAGATVRLICAEAGLTPRYFYESFADPIALLLAAFEEAIAHLELILRTALNSAPEDPEARLKAVLTAYYARLRDDAAVARVFLADMHGRNEMVDARFRKALQGFGRSFREIVPDMAKAPALYDDGLAGGLNQIALAWAHSGHSEPLTEVVEAALRLFPFKSGD